MERNERRSVAPRPATPGRRGRVRLTISKGVLRLVGVPNSPAKLRLPLIESGAARSSSPLPIRSGTGVINDGAPLCPSLSLSLFPFLVPFVLAGARTAPLPFFVLRKD